jgi:hypothetical protein
MNKSDDDIPCPICGRSMRVLTTFGPVTGEKALVLKCRPCGLSTTKTGESEELGTRCLPVAFCRQGYRP